MSVVSSAEDLVVSACDQLLSTQLGAEAVILNLHSGVYFGLDPVGARVWELIEQQNPISLIKLCDAILAEFDVEPDRCRQDISELLQNMKAEGLVQLSPPAP